MSASFTCFVTGTDTGVGKTLVSAALLHTLAAHGVRAAGIKSVAAGSEMRDGRWCNHDAEQLAAAASLPLPPEIATPYLLREAAAPHISASLEGVEIDTGHILACCRLAESMAEAVVVEGVGGFRVPLSATRDTADLAQELNWPVILVVGLRLGCLNHALLTAEAIADRGLTLAGWAGNVVELGMPHGLANLDALVARLPAPFLGCVPRLPSALPAAAATHLDFSNLPGWPGAHVTSTW